MPYSYGDYATVTSVSILLPKFLKADTTTMDDKGTAIFGKHIQRAEGVVNSFVGQRYALPFIVGTTTTNVPPILRSLTEDLACYYAMRGTLNQDGKNMNPYLGEFKSAMDILKDISTGDLLLTDTTGAQVTPLSTSRFLSTTKTYTPVFALDSATAWRRDPEEVTDTQTKREEV